MRVGVALERQADDPKVASVLAREGEFGEGGAVFVVLADGPEAMIVALKGPGSSCGENPRSLEDLAPAESGVDAARVEGRHVAHLLAETGARYGPARSVLQHAAHGEDGPPAPSVVPEEPWAHGETAELGDVRPAVRIDVGVVLSMCAGEERVAPPLAEVVGEPAHDVGPVEGALVQDELPCRVRAT